MASVQVGLQIGSIWKPTKAFHAIGDHGIVSYNGDGIFLERLYRGYAMDYDMEWCDRMKGYLKVITPRAEAGPAPQGARDYRTLALHYNAQGQHNLAIRDYVASYETKALDD